MELSNVSANGAGLKLSSKARTLKTLIPWVLTLAIFYYLFKRYPPGHLLQATKHLQISYFLVYGTLYFFFMCLVDCWTTSWLFTRFGFPTSIREVLPVRFASYLIMVFNYAAGQGMFAYFFNKAKEVPFLKSSSLILFLMIVDLYWTISLAFAGSFFANLVVRGIDLTGGIQTIWIVTTLALIALAVFWKLPLQGKFLDWIRSRDLLHTLRHAKFSDFCLMMAMRLPMHIAINTSLYVAALTFGVSVPFLRVIAYFPVVVLIGTIPITPAGLGTIQVITVEFFKNHLHGNLIDQGLLSPSELLISMSLVFTFYNCLLKILTGAFFLPKVRRYQPPRESPRSLP